MEAAFRAGASNTRRVPGVFLDANFFWDGQRQDDDEADDEERKTLVSVPVVWHLPISGTRYGLVQGDADWRRRSLTEDRSSSATQQREGRSSSMLQAEDV